MHTPVSIRMGHWDQSPKASQLIFSFPMKNPLMIDPAKTNICDFRGEPRRRRMGQTPQPGSRPFFTNSRKAPIYPQSERRITFCESFARVASFDHVDVGDAAIDEFESRGQSEDAGSDHDHLWGRCHYASKLRKIAELVRTTGSRALPTAGNNQIL